jgi:hypothetical protein
MKHDFSISPEGPDADAFKQWLLDETVAMLRESYGDLERTKSTIFLYVNRAYEAHLPETETDGMFGVAVVRAGYSEREEQAMFDWLDFFAAIASKVHRPS